MKRSLFSRASGSIGSSCGSARCFCDSWGINRTSCSNARALWKRHQSGTYLYTAIFAAALTVDAREKSRRTQQWDDALAQVNEEAELLKAAANEREKKLKKRGRFVEAFVEQDSVFNSDAPLDLEKTIDDQNGIVRNFSPLNPVPLTLDSIQKHSLDEPRHASVKHLFRSTLKSSVNGGEIRTPQNWLPPQSIGAGSNVRRRVRDDNTWTQKKINLMEIAVARLVLDILRSGAVGTMSSATASQVKEGFERLQPWVEAAQALDTASGFNPTWYNDFLAHRLVIANLDKWEKDDRPAWPIQPPTYRPDTHINLQKGRELLHNSLQTSFRQWEAASQRSNSVAEDADAFTFLCLEVCDALLQSSAAPDITTLNILLVGFLESQRVLPVTKQRLLFKLDTFRRNTNLRPNEITCATTLKAYRKAKDWQGLSKYLALMRGEGQGLMLARPDTRITAASQGRVREHITKSGRRKLVQAVMPNPLLMVEMIKGMLDYANFEEAYRLLDELKPEGWLPDWHCLETLLFDCLRRQDWNSGQLIWKEIQALGREELGIPNQIYSAFLALCHLCKQKIDFHIVFKQASATSPHETILAEIRGILKIIREAPEATINITWRQTVETAIVEADLSTQPKRAKTAEEHAQQALLERVQKLETSTHIEVVPSGTTVHRLYDGEIPDILPPSMSRLLEVESDVQRSSGKAEMILPAQNHPPTTRVLDSSTPQSKLSRILSQRSLAKSQADVVRTPIWRAYKLPAREPRHHSWMLDDDDTPSVEIAAHG